MVLGLLVQLSHDDMRGWHLLAGPLVAALGFWLALMLYADLDMRSRQAEVPTALRGLPIQLIGAGLMAMAFSGLNGLFAQ